MKWLPFTIRWIARLAALAVAALYGALIASEIAHPHARPPNHWLEWAGLAFLTLGVLFEVLAALTSYSNREVSLALVSMGCFALWLALIPTTQHEVVWLMAAPAGLFVADWTLRKWFGFAT